MKLILKVLGALLVIAIALAAGAIGSAFLGRRSIVDGVEINGARIVQDGIVSVVVIPVGIGKVMLVDAGNDSEGTAIINELTRRSLTPDAVVAIALTHGHADHIAAVRRFPNAQVMALEREVRLVEGREGTRSPLLRMMPATPNGIQVSTPLHDEDVLTVGDLRVQVFAVPGHTAGSAAYLINSVLYIGDSADTANDGSMRGSPWIFSDSQEDNRASLVKLDERLKAGGFGVDAIVPAHSAAMTDGLTRLDAYAASPK
jgi:glyoxylase-like metal-dependent hydrolase (beta-lactamase superfamily II)